jgi:hypothetical protein
VQNAAPELFVKSRGQILSEVPQEQGARCEEPAEGRFRLPLCVCQSVEKRPMASRLAQGDLHLHGWVYKIETGEVFAYDLASGQFVPLAEYKFPASEAAVRLRNTADI